MRRVVDDVSIEPADITVGTLTYRSYRVLVHSGQAQIQDRDHQTLVTADAVVTLTDPAGRWEAVTADGTWTIVSSAGCGCNGQRIEQA